MGLPGMQSAGASMLANLWSAAQQQQQFEQSQGQQAAQFNDRQNLALEEANARRWEGVENRQARAAEFAANQDYRGQSLAIERGRLGLAALAQRDANADRDAARAADIAKAQQIKPKDGYQWYVDAEGQPAQAPIRGTPDYVSGSLTAEQLGAGTKAASDILSIGWGPMRTEGPLAGKRDPSKAQGYSSFGAEAGKLGASYQALRTAVLTASGGSKNMSDEEQRQFESSLANPSNFSSLATDRQRAAVEYWQTYLASKQKAHLRANQWLLPPGARLAGG
jgi:hypothetical protein